MSELDSTVVRIPIQLTRDCLVASIQFDLSGDVLRRFQHDLLDRIASTHASGVVLDVSGVEIMDADDFNALRRAGEMARVMGARPVMVGLRPGVVAGLIDLGVPTDGVVATLDLESALELVASGQRPTAGQDSTAATDGPGAAQDPSDDAT